MAVIGGPNLIINGLVSMWDVASPESSPGSGTVWTDLIGNNDGTLTNGPITAEGINKGIISFDGTDDYIDLDDTAGWRPLSTFTWSIWFYVDSIPVAGGLDSYSLIATGGGCGDPPYNTELHIPYGSLNSSPKSVSAASEVGSANAEVTSEVGSIVAGKWFQAVYVYNDSGYDRLFLDGILKSSVSNIGASVQDNTFRIGSGGFCWGANYFSGKISNTYVYNRALTAAEIKQNYNATKGRFSITSPIVKENLVLHLDAGDSDSYPGTGTTWTDLVGSYNATLTNGPVHSSSVGGGSFEFDGTNDYMNLGDVLDVGTGDFTIEMWIYRDGGGGAMAMYAKEIASASPQFRFMLNEVGTGKITFSGVGVYFHSTTTVGSATWSHVVLRRSGLNLKFFINSVGDATATSASLIDSTSAIDLRLGARVGAGGTGSHAHLNGKIAVVRHYNQAISDGQVLQNYEAQKGRFV